LHEIMQSERSFVRIHAAEALMAAGEADAVREYFTRELPNTETSAFRVGVWRVLANTARSADERNRWIAKVERTYCDQAAPDRGTAIETLCKLRHRVSGRALELVRREAAGAPSGPTVLALWSAQLAGDPHALGGLIAMLGSNDALVRRGAAYALRWLEPSDSVTRQALVRAVTREPPGSQAYAYILGAALTVGADPGQARTWEAELDRVLAAGPTDARFEASWTLKHRYRAADLPRVAALLDLPAKENDARIGAAAIILATLARP
jgi:HEAT repeat protein